MKQIKKLNLDELKQIYKTHVKEDFPRSERRPYSSMEKMTNTGKYVSFGYYDDDSLLAYACYIVSASEKGMLPQGTPFGCACPAALDVRGTSVQRGPKRSVDDERDHNRALCGYDILTENGLYALLDYFAVVPELRGHGIGSEFLQKLGGTLPAKNGAFIEVESPDSAKSEEEAALRRRRIHFYLSNGAVLTNTKCLLFGVDYNILYIGRTDDTDPAPEQLHYAIEDLYREIYRPVYGRLCKPYVQEKHPPEKVIFMNMCMLCDGDQVLALDKTGSSYNGTTFPGGHVEAGETFSEAVIREMKEETGLTIQHPVLKGIYHWYRDGLHNVGLLYRADSFEGELKSSEEGQVYWISREEYEKKELAAGMPRVLQIMDDDSLTECFEELKPDGSFLEHLF